MPNEMMRPCTLWGVTFDACYVLKLSTSYVRANTHHVFIGGEWVSSPAETGRYVVVSTTSRRYFSPLVKTGEERQALLLEAITTIAEALNPPIMVTQAVLNAMVEAGGAYIAKSILVDAPDYSYNLHFDNQKKAFTFRGGMAFDVNEQDVPIYTVQADCPLGLQLLLQFNTEGEPHA